MLLGIPMLFVMLVLNKKYCINKQEGSLNRAGIFLVYTLCLLFIFIYPTYSDYTGRTHVAEGTALAAGARFQFEEFYKKYKRFPQNNLEAGLSDRITGQAVKSIFIKNGQLIITYNKKVKDNSEIILTPFIETNNKTTIKIKWICKTNMQDRSKRIPEKDLPSNCRN